MHSWKPDEALKTPLVKSKVLVKSDDCDVVSLLEENIQKKSVNAEYRLECLKRKFAQRYMQSAWKGFEFINSLKTNKILLNSKQNMDSFNAINREIDDGVETTGKFIVKSFHFVWHWLIAFLSNSHNSTLDVPSTLMPTKCFPILDNKRRPSESTNFDCSMRHAVKCS